jgi:type IV secretory pathway VirB10-like protein
LGAGVLGGCATDPYFWNETKHYRRSKPVKKVAARSPRAEEPVIAKKTEAPAEPQKAETAAVPVAPGAPLQPIETGTLQQPKAASEADVVTKKEDPRWKWCEQRHLDYQAGRTPGGAIDLADKLDGDRICAGIYERAD